VNLFDSSALLCFLEREKGAATVERALASGGACSAANWSEVAQKIRSRDRDWDLVSSLLMSYGLVIEPVTRADAEDAARLWKRGSGLSLADRICIATAHRLSATVWTADSAWGKHAPIRQVR
jgi:PIN domain nuclease of toxin-antitoxin system